MRVRGGSSVQLFYIWVCVQEVDMDSCLSPELNDS